MKFNALSALFLAVDLLCACVYACALRSPICREARPRPPPAGMRLHCYPGRVRDKHLCNTEMPSSPSWPAVRRGIDSSNGRPF